MTAHGADFAYKSDQEFFELVWEDGQLVMRGFPKRSTQNNPSSIGHVSHSSNIAHEKNREVPIFSPKKPRFATVGSLVEDGDPNPHRDNKKDSNLNFTHKYSSQGDDKYHDESLPELYQTHFDVFRGNSCDKLHKDSQVVPAVHGLAHLKSGCASDYLASNSQPADSSFLQQYQALTPFIRERVKFRSPNLLSLGLLPNSKLKEDDIKPDRKKETVNFSIFSRSPAKPTNSRGFSRADQEFKNSSKTSCPENDDLFAPNKGSKRVKGLENQSNSIGINPELLPLIANSPDKSSLPDAQSEALSRRDWLTNKRSPDQVYGQTSTLPANYAVKGNVSTQQSIAPPAASSSFCSRGASNNPTLSLKTRYEDTDVSAHLSYEKFEEKEEESLTKTAPDRRSKFKRKKRPAEVHNLSERKRRDKINKRMRALQELIPNCKMMDKASLLDEAIKYVKTLQFRLQIMSMGNGVGMPPPMMLPPGMHAPQIIHFSPMTMGMGMRSQMGVGYNLSQFLASPVPGATSVPGLAETRFQMPGFPGQPLPMSMSHAPLMGPMQKTVPVSGVSRVAASTELMDSGPNISNSKDSDRNIKDNVANVDCSKIRSSA